MSVGAVAYKQGMPRDDACIICGSTKALVNDHCHEHGWVRGTVCSGCNSLMCEIDKGFIPSTTGLRVGSADLLIVHRLRCHDCKPRSFQTWDGRYISANLTPSAATKLRALTAAMTIETGKRVTTSALVVALTRVAENHKAELVAELAPEPPTEP